MPTIDENKLRWSTYEWAEGGDEWSAAWGGTENLWHASLWPRIRFFLPATRVVEIAPGYGRFTQYLVANASRLSLVDLTPECIEACRRRFADFDHIEYHVNDGKSLDAIADGSVDFLFSFDSLVHAEIDAVGGYVRELDRVLSPEGVAFLHHSNVGEFVNEDGNCSIENRHWRGASVSAQRVREIADAQPDLTCFAQEKIAWGGGPELSDCLSAFARPAHDAAAAGYRVRENHEFVIDGVRLSQASHHFASGNGSR